MKLNIAQKFTPFPEGRYASESDLSGESFREKILLPKFRAAAKSGEALEVSLEGMRMLTPSFLEEAFGGLVKKLAQEGVDLQSIQKTLIITAESPQYGLFIDDVRQYMQESADTQGR